MAYAPGFVGRFALSGRRARERVRFIYPNCDRAFHGEVPSHRLSYPFFLLIVWGNRLSRGLDEP